MARFQSTPSAKRATWWHSSESVRPEIFQSTPSAKRATRRAQIQDRIYAFQSTPSAKRATERRRARNENREHFNPRPPRRGRHLVMDEAIKRNNFNPRPPRRGRLDRRSRSESRTAFQSTPSAKRATQRLQRLTYDEPISIHALREEGDDKIDPIQRGVLHFNPRPPRRGRPQRRLRAHSRREFQSTPSAKRATRKEHKNRPKCTISIHALREEGDTGGRDRQRSAAISIHALREEGDARQSKRLLAAAISIHALREEGDAKRREGTDDHDISIHALREEGDRFFRLIVHRIRIISIHALREEGDRILSDHCGNLFPFQSTPSAKRATDGCITQQNHQTISIHALREEGDSNDFCSGNTSFDFNPRPPRRGRRQQTQPSASLTNFNPRPPRRGRLTFSALSLSVQSFQSTPSAKRAT